MPQPDIKISQYCLLVDLLNPCFTSNQFLRSTVDLKLCTIYRIPRCRRTRSCA